MKRKMLTVCILEVLNDHASKENKIFQEDILEYLEKDHDTSITRKTLSSYLPILADYGYIYYKKNKNGIYKINKFSDEDLRILIDSIMYSKHIPQNKVNNLISKLKELSPVGLKGKMENVRYINSIYRTKNTGLYEVLDEIDRAIEKNKQVEITRCRYNVKGELEDFITETIHPYYIVASNSRYYVICYAERDNKLESRRIDRISKAITLDGKGNENRNKNRKPLSEILNINSHFDLGKYMREHVYMFSGKSVQIKIKMKKNHISYFVDSFGDDFRARNIEGEDDYVEITTKNNENATYYWALQYGELAEILEPKNLRDRVRQGLENILKKYQNKDKG